MGSLCSHLGGESCIASFCTHGPIVHKLLYLYTWSAFTLEPEEGFANSEPDQCGECFDIPIGPRHWSMSMTHIIQDFIHSLHILPLHICGGIPLTSD